MSRPSITLIPPLIEKSLKNAFKVQVNTTASVARMSMDATSVDKFNIDCLSTLMLKSSTLVGTLSIGFGTPEFLGMLSSMLGEPYAEITAENSDAAGEMLNIIYANARKEINEAGFDFEPSIPTTVIGKSMHLAKSNLAGQALFFECTSDFGPFLMTLSLRAKPGS